MPRMWSSSTWTLTESIMDVTDGRYGLLRYFNSALFYILPSNSTSPLSFCCPTQNMEIIFTLIVLMYSLRNSDSPLSCILNIKIVDVWGLYISSLILFISNFLKLIYIQGFDKCYVIIFLWIMDRSIRPYKKMWTYRTFE